MFHVKHFVDKDIDKIGAIAKKGSLDKEDLLVGDIPNFFH